MNRLEESMTENYVYNIICICGRESEHHKTAICGVTIKSIIEEEHTSLYGMKSK